MRPNHIGSVRDDALGAARHSADDGRPTARPCAGRSSGRPTRRRSRRAGPPREPRIRSCARSWRPTSALLDAIVAVTVASNSLLAVLERDAHAVAMLHATRCAVDQRRTSSADARRSSLARRPAGRAAPLEAPPARCASRHATCSASPTCARSAPSSRRSRPGVPRRRARDRRAGGADGRDRHGQARRRASSTTRATSTCVFVHDGDERPRPSTRRARCCA